MFVRGAHVQEPSGARIADTPGLGGVRANARCRQFCLQVLLLLQWVCADDGELVFILDNAFSWFNDKVHEQADAVGTGV
eukprot:COSAG01_NODE_7720_length_3085_cov_1.808104_4_plen_79_part_00